MSNELKSHPDPSQWDEYVDFESTAWPKKERRKYWIIPSVCFNCESACGILAYVDQESLDVRKIEGNPLHPGSRGRTCAKGVVTPNQLDDPDRILYPMRRTGARGKGGWERVTWDAALDDIGTRIRTAILEGRRDEVMYHVGRPGEDGYANRVLQAWGIDGHNSHTNVCSSSARLGHFLWTGADRPSPDYANARTILLLSSHLETGHYFNPHAQRIVEARADGATLITMDPRLSNTSAKADIWLPAYPGTEAALLLAIVRILLVENLYDREFVRRWVNWQAYLRAERPDLPETFESFVLALHELYSAFTPEFAAEETGVPAERILQAARAIASAGNRFATHSWRAASAGNLWGWQITRCLYLLVVLTGSVGSVGGVNLHVTNKFVPEHPESSTTAGLLERAALSARVSAGVPRVELSAAALSQGRTRPPRRVFHPRLQPGVDQPRRVLVDGGPPGSGQDRVARRSIANVERDRVVRGLHPAHGSRNRAARHHEPGNARWSVAGVSPARAPSRAREARRGRLEDIRGQSGRGVGGIGILDLPQLEDRSRRCARHSTVFREPVSA